MKEELLKALIDGVDEPLASFGFARNGGSLIYSRTLNSSVQQINFVYDCLPKAQSTTEVHIHPMLRIAMHDVSQKALELVRGDVMLLAGSPEIIVNQPIEFTAPKDLFQRWFVNGSRNFTSSCEAIKDFILLWVLPFLSAMSTPSDLIKLCEDNDSRIMKQKHWYIFVAAAYECLGESEKAREVVRQQFGRSGLRRRYAPLFTSLAIE